MHRISAVVLALCVSFSVGAQEVYNSSGTTVRRANARKPQKPRGFDRDRLVIGGTPVISFGNGSLALGVAPIVGYRFTERFLAGVGANYTYYKQRDAYQVGATTYDFKAHVYSGSVWARYLVFENIFAHAEYEHNFTNYTDVGFDPNGSGNIQTTWVKYNSPALLLGGGYRSPISERSSLIAMILYDVIQDKYSPYRGGPSIRFGVNVGF